jgi:hypothetical protein
VPMCAFISSFLSVLVSVLFPQLSLIMYSHISMPIFWSKICAVQLLCKWK